MRIYYENGVTHKKSVPLYYRISKFQSRNEKKNDILSEKSR